MSRKSSVYITAVCGVVSALELAVLYMSGIFQVLDLSLAALTVLFSVVILIEYGKKPVWVIYGVVSVLAMLIVPSKFPAICYVLFFGCYPILKAYLEKLKKIISWVLKLVFFNVGFMAAYVLSVRFLLVDDIAAVGTKYFYIALAVANLAFVLFDYVLTLIITLYIFKLRKKFGFDKLFKK